jgi:hypothetical protein
VAYAQANFLRGNFDLATDFIRKQRLDLTLEGYTLLCQISWERGDRQIAVNRLSDAARTFPNAEHLRAMLARWLATRGRARRRLAPAGAGALGLGAAAGAAAHPGPGCCGAVFPPNPRTGPPATATAPRP